jgi:hypothetical protein
MDTRTRFCKAPLTSPGGVSVELLGVEGRRRQRGGSPRTSERRARPECSGRARTVVAPFAGNERCIHRQEIVTVEGAEAIPLAMTTSVLWPAGVPGGRVNLVEDLVPGATDTEVQSVVRA